MPALPSRPLAILALALLPQWLAGQQFLDDRLALTANQPPHDIDSDGLPDLLHLEVNGTLSWQRNLGNLRFASLQTLGTLPSSSVFDVVLPGDLDGDGDTDVLSLAEGTTSPPSMRLDLLQQQSPGVFVLIPLANVTTAVASYPSAIVRTDFDGDGDLDLVLGTGEPAGLCMHALRNDGSLLYTDVTATRFAGVGIGNVTRIRASDIDGDGRQDLIVDAPSLRVLRNVGTAYVDETSTRLPTAQAVGAVLGDLDGDGDADVVTNVPFQGTQVWINQAGIYVDATATALPSPIPAGAPSNLFDSDSDGDLDLLLRGDAQSQTSPTRQAALVLRNDGTGRLLQAVSVTPFLVASLSSPSVTADLEGDGDDDIVLLGSPTKVLVNHGASVLLGAEAAALAGPAADMNGDGVPDFLTGDGVLLQRPLAAATLRPWIGGTPAGLTPAHIGDVDGDGDLDLIGAGLWRNDGTGNLAFDAGSGLPTGSFLAVLGDGDGDGDLDALVVIANTVQLFTNNGLGQFAAAGSTPTLSQAVLDLAAGDIDGDGDLDAAIPGFLASPPRLLLNQGNGTFTVVSAPSTGAIGTRVQFLDLRGTGQTDLFMLSVGTWSAFRLQGGALVNVTATVVPPGLAGQRLAVGDVDRDGDLDIVGRDLLRNDGTGNYTIEPLGLVGAMQLLDLDGDQDLDVIAGNLVRKNRERDLTAPVEAHIGRALRLDVVAAPGRAQGEVAVLAASLQQAQPAVPTPFGLLHLNTIDAYWLLALPNVSGLAEIDLPVPNAPAIVGIALTFQSMHFGIGGVGLANGIRTRIE